MLAIEVGLSLVVLGVSGFFPGFYLVRRLRWNPMEKLCGSIGLSLIFIYLVAGVTYCVLPGALRSAGWAYSILSAVLGGLCWKDAGSLTRTFSVRRSLKGYAFLLVWTLVLLAMIRNYSGAWWEADWLEHFQRSLFFLHHFPLDAKMLGIYLVPARPPFMNVVCAFLMAQTQGRFEIFQADAAVLNLLVFLACCLMLPALAGKRRMHILPLVGLFAMSPAMMEAATYTWTKALPAFFTVMAFWFYLAGWRKRDPRRMSAAFLALAAGLLVHYSAGPYCLFFALHYLIFVFPKRRHKMRELAAITVPAALLLSTWFAWSIANYGTKVTMASNTSVTTSQQYAGRNVEKIIGNIADTLIPAIFRDRSLMEQFHQPSYLGRLRDNFFITYQGNLIFGMGLVGGPFVLLLLIRKIHQSPAGNPAPFWRLAIPFCVVAGIATTGERDPMGVAHLTLLTLVLLGITLVASAFPPAGMARWLILAGCCADFSLGVFLNARIENLDIHSAPRVQSAATLSSSGPANWFWKHQDAFTAGTQTAAQKLDYDYQGWYGRHQGGTEFLGDHLAGPSIGGLDVPSLLLLGMWISVLGLMSRTAPRTSPAP